MSAITILVYLIVFFGVINLVRMTMFIVGSDIYSYGAKKTQGKKLKRFYPAISIIIPAHNEEKTVLRAVRSLVRNKYPRHKRQIILVDDGSTDKTAGIIEKYKKDYNVSNLLVMKQAQKGKAHALNNAMKKYAVGEIVMCLDSDSYLLPDGLRKVVNYFRNPSVAAVSANVKIIPSGSFLNLIQQFEYMICYQMKRAQTVFNIEYIIGGIGSTFRRSVLEKIGYYDSDTVTEDIDLTMKILQLGNKNIRVVYGADVVAYTESVLDLNGLIKQRFRWKWGRCQTFLKNANMFFSRDSRFTKGLTFFYLPFAIFCDIAFLFEPLIVLYIFYIVIRFGDFTTLFSIVVLISTYIILNILMENTIQGRDKLKYIIAAPFMYFFFYILSFVEYVALIKAVVRLPFLRKSISQKACRWDHVERLDLKQLKTTV